MIKVKSNKKSVLPTTNYSLLTSGGFALIEVMISMVVALAIIGIFGTLSAYATKMNRMNRTVLQGTLYLREAIEAVKDLEQSNWGEIITCEGFSECYPSSLTGNWLLLGGVEILEGRYTRRLSVFEVCRNISEEIAPCGVNPTDPLTKRAQASVTWDNGFFDQTITLETYVYNQ